MVECTYSEEWEDTLTKPICKYMQKNELVISMCKL